MDPTTTERLTPPATGDLTTLDRLADRLRARATSARITSMEVDPIQTHRTITFLFTDIEGSTRMLRDIGDAYADVLGHQRDVIRDACLAQGATEFGAEGDALFFAFDRASRAVAAAVDAQRALTREAEVRVRMGLHTGEAALHDGDYIGLAVHQAARICSAGHGGQIVASEATITLVKESLPEGLTVIDLGDHHLKDLAGAQRLYQVSHPELQRDFPPLRSLDTLPNNLPVQLTSFVGRAAEMAEIRRLMEASRLLTLTGSGGAGKTRLALQVAADLTDRFADGVWLVELAPITNGTLVPTQVASVLGVATPAGESIVDALARGLRDRVALLVLDNCEHLADACAELADRLLRRAPNLQILATSREILGVEGEATWRVPSMSLPGSDVANDIETLTQYEAVRLFIERARAASPGLEISGRDAPAIAQICSRLDGIPLALELAAPCVRMLSFEQIAGKLDDRFSLLTGGSRTALPRQKTLRALIDWSYDLLSDDERALLRCLSIFPSGFDIEALQAACVGQDVVWLMSQLVNKSLVTVSHSNGSARYELLETIRQYAAEKLDTGSESVARTRHLDHFLALAKGHASLDPGDIAVVKTEEDNMRAALAWAKSRPEDGKALELAEALTAFWSATGRWAEARSHLEEALATGPKDATTARAKILTSFGYFTAEAGEYDRAWALHTEARAIARSLGDQLLEAIILRNMVATTLTANDMFTHASIADESVDTARSVGDSSILSSALRHRAHPHGLREPADAIADLAEALELARARDDASSMIDLMLSMGMWEFKRGDPEAGRQRYREALSLARETKIDWAIAKTLTWLTGSAQGREEAWAMIREAIDVAREANDPTTLWETLMNAGVIARSHGDLDAASQYSNEALSMAKELGAPWMKVHPEVTLGIVALERDDLDGAEEQFRHALLDSRSWADEAEPATRLAEVAIRRGRFDEARDVIEYALARSARSSQRTRVARLVELMAETEVGLGRAEESERLRGWSEILRQPVGSADEVRANEIVATVLEPVAARLVARGEVPSRRHGAYLFAQAAQRWHAADRRDETLRCLRALTDATDDEEAVETYRALTMELEETAADGWARLSGDLESAAMSALRACSREPVDVRLELPMPDPVPSSLNEFARVADGWRITFGGSTVTLRDTKGLRYLAMLLAEPGREFHVADIVGVAESAEAATTAIDARARDEYRDRLRAASLELEEAITWADNERASSLQIEIDAIVGQLASAYGIGGRPRVLGDPVERMRKSVGNRVRDAIARISRVNPRLSAHLGNAIKTGTYCVYAPEAPREWVT